MCRCILIASLLLTYMLLLICIYTTCRYIHCIAICQGIYTLQYPRHPKGLDLCSEGRHTSNCVNSEEATSHLMGVALVVLSTSTASPTHESLYPRGIPRCHLQCSRVNNLLYFKWSTAKPMMRRVCSCIVCTRTYGLAVQVFEAVWLICIRIVSCCVWCVGGGFVPPPAPTHSMSQLLTGDLCNVNSLSRCAGLQSWRAQV